MQKFNGIPLEDVKNIVGTCVSSPTFFGPIFWSVMEVLALTDEEGFWMFIEILKKKIPCEECHKHFLQNISFIISLAPREFLQELHNIVSLSGGKRTYSEIERLEEIYTLSQLRRE